MILGESPFLSERTRDNSQIIGEEKSMQAFLISKKKLFPVNRITKQRRQVTGKMATMRPRGSVHKKKGCIAIGREIVPVRSAFLDGSFLFSVWRGYEGAPQTMDFVGDQGDQSFVFFWSSPSDMEVLEDFSPLSTNATYWRTCQDPFEGAMPQCLRGDACGGFATGKYSQTIVGKRYFDFWFK